MVILPLFLLLGATKKPTTVSEYHDPIEAKISALDSMTLNSTTELDGLYYNNIKKLHTAVSYLDSINQNEQSNKLDKEK